MTYDQWMAETAQIVAGYQQTHAGADPGYLDVAHILWRRTPYEPWPSVEKAMEEWGYPQPEPPSPPVHPNPLVGRLRLTDAGFADDTGPVLPCFCHAGDLFSLYTRDPERARRELRDIAAAGYHGLRVWTVLDGEYWTSKGREIGPDRTYDYWPYWEGFCMNVQALALRLAVSQGDAMAVVQDRKDFAAGLAQMAIHVVQSPELYAFFDGGNETWQNGEPDPAKLAEFVQHYRDAGGTALLTLSSPDGEEKVALDAFSIPPADLFDVHGHRAGHWYDKIRHIFSIAYEGKPRHRHGIQSEPTGPGEYVSVTDNKHELDAETLSLMAAMATISRQAWVYFSGEGVSIRAGLATEPGFAAVPALLRLLPRDLMAYETLHHSGRATWPHMRMLATDEPDVRVDGRTAEDGRTVQIAYGPSGRHSFDATRAFTGHILRYVGQDWVAEPLSWAVGSTVLSTWTRGVVLVGRVT